VSYITYKLVHFAGIFMLIAALAATCMNAMRGGPRTEYAWRRALGAAHGIAVFLILLGGFGMLARLGIMRAEDGFPGWVLAKMAIWFVLGAAFVLPRFGRGFARALLVAAPVLAAGAGAIALLKPF
jgi:uncharacterized membrane protein SirB2